MRLAKFGSDVLNAIRYIYTIGETHTNVAQLIAVDAEFIMESVVVLFKNCAYEKRITEFW
jgi:hypothetical protein